MPPKKPKPPEPKPHGFAFYAAERREVLVVFFHGVTPWHNYRFITRSVTARDPGEAPAPDQLPRGVFRQDSGVYGAWVDAETGELFEYQR